MATITNIEKRVVTFDIECKVQQADRVRKFTAKGNIFYRL